ncbi:hypothetical protein DdX_03980 [Ditylenchus destructor]|uniref:Uncharacterized protein n=1 Tax=Ditylenchus destructor TaxID=166010 RepID=A0AAD4RBM8_9BILA|nr:hypothetical protein DdX_03980 [Ditylenchus destructor]
MSTESNDDVFSGEHALSNASSTMEVFEYDPLSTEEILSKVPITARNGGGDSANVAQLRMSVRNMGDLLNHASSELDHWQRKCESLEREKQELTLEKASLKAAIEELKVQCEEMSKLEEHIEMIEGENAQMKREIEALRNEQQSAFVYQRRIINCQNEALRKAELAQKEAKQICDILEEVRKQYHSEIEKHRETMRKFLDLKMKYDQDMRQLEEQFSEAELKATTQRRGYEQRIKQLQDELRTRITAITSSTYTAESEHSRNASKVDNQL